LLRGLARVDDYCDKLDIGLVKINDLELVTEYNLGELPALVYYRHAIPVLYEGDLTAEEDILEWLIQNRSSGDEEDVIEEVEFRSLQAMVSAVENIAVLFYNSKSAVMETVLESMETIDDDCDVHGVHFVKISDPAAAYHYGISSLPALVYFKNSAANIYEGSLEDEEPVLAWLLTHLEAAEIEEVSNSALGRLIKEVRNLVVIFYKRGDRSSTEALELLENIDDDLDRVKVGMVKVSEAEAFKDWGVSGKCSVFYFELGIPNIYPGDVSSERDLLHWVKVQLAGDDIEDVNSRVLARIVEGELGSKVVFGEHTDVAVLFYKRGDENSEKVLKSLENIDDDCEEHGIPFVKIGEERKAKSLGITELPSLVYYEDQLPNIYTGDLGVERDVLDWLVEQLRQDGIEEVTGEILDTLIETHQAVIAVFYDQGDKASQHCLAALESIDDELDEVGIPAVKMADKTEARQYGVKSFPSVIVFVKRVPELYPGDVRDEAAVLNWALTQAGLQEDTEVDAGPAVLDLLSFPAAAADTDPSPTPKVAPKAAPPTDEQPTATREGADKAVETEESVDELSEVLDTIKNDNNVVAFFYQTMDKIAKKIVNGLDRVEGNFIGKDIQFLAVDIDEVPDIEVASVPSLIYFKNGEPVVYEENLLNEEAIQQWVENELKSNLDVIEDLNTEQIHDLMEENEYVMVYLYKADCEACDEAIKQLEQIDDDADAVGVKFVKTDEESFATEFGIDTFPTILYFEHGQPSIYDGDAAEETELLTWLLYQMKEDTVENINRELLIKMIDEFEFLAVFFYEDDEDSVKALRHLELIDDEATQYGVRMVKIADPLMSKKYGHRSPPGLGFFRKGNYIKYDGDLLDDEEMLDWLTDPNVMEISDQIEKVNKKMFEKLITRNEFLTVLFYSDTDCKQCEGVLQEMENIDDDAETAGIPIVKLEDKELAKTVGVFALPAVVFFRNFGEEAVIYTGDLKREESILEWLMVQKDPSNDAIEELEGEELTKTIETADAIAVFIYSHEECENCLDTLTELENIDDDVERQKIKMAKTTDAAFAEEVGVDKYPALVFFKDGVPNLYEGDLAVEEEVLDWLTEMKVESHIELITRPMLETMVEETQYLAVFFYKQNCRTCDQVIGELENIDDECDMFGIQMVKLKDPPLAKRYGIKTFPALVYFRNGNPLTFDGDLKSEESVLEWLVDDDNRELEDEIEAVNFRMLDKLLETSSLMAVFFCMYNL